MMFGDDEDDIASGSHPDQFTRADHGKRENVERKAAAKGQLLQLKRVALMGQVDKQSLKQLQKQVANEDKDDAKKTADADAKAQEGKGDFGPKSNTEEAKEAVQTAQQQSSSEQLIKDSQRQQAAEQAAGQEYQQDVG